LRRLTATIHLTILISILLLKITILMLPILLLKQLMVGQIILITTSLLLLAFMMVNTHTTLLVKIIGTLIIIKPLLIIRLIRLIKIIPGTSPRHIIRVIILEEKVILSMIILL